MVAVVVVVEVGEVGAVVVALVLVGEVVVGKGGGAKGVRLRPEHSF
jgi:hypothetical protein